MAMVISDSFPCFNTLTDVQWETEYACHYLGLHLLTVMALYICI